MIELLRALWPDPPDGPDTNVSIWEMPGKTTLHVPLRQLLQSTESDLQELQEMMAGHDVYFGHALRCDGLDEHTRGGKKHCTWLPGWVLDIDTAAPGAHKTGNLPVTMADVESILEIGPEPMAVVATGNGVHCYWRFPESRRLTCEAERKAAANAFEAFQRRYIERARELGWHLDLTASIDRVWRLPGFKNQKGT